MTRRKRAQGGQRSKRPRPAEVAKANALRRASEESLSLPEHETFSWMADDGLHMIVPGQRPDPETVEQMTRRYQQHLRESPVFDELVRQYGLDRAEELLLECRAEIR